MHRITVAPAEAGRKLHRFLKARLPGVPRGFMFRALREGEIRVNGQKAGHEYVLKSGDVVESVIPFSKHVEPAPAHSLPAAPPELTVLYEDDWILAMNKPSGLAMHPGTGLRTSLTDFLRTDSGDEGYRPAPVHRLDRETSGVVLVAKTLIAHQRLAKQFESGQVSKVYLALTDGVPREKSGSIERSLERRSSRAGEKVFVSEAGVLAVTDYRVLEQARGIALIELRPRTGKLHQLRAHLKSIGCSVLNDERYSGKEARGRMMLHAWKISFISPGDGKPMTVIAPIPRHFAEALRGQKFWIPT